MACINSIAFDMSNRLVHSRAHILGFQFTKVAQTYTNKSKRASDGLQ